MILSSTARLLLAVSSGVAFALAFPPFHIAPLGWIALAALILAVLNASPRFSLLLGWLQGAVFYALSLPWIYTVMRRYGPLPVIEAAGVFALLVFAAGAFHGAFGFGVAWFSRGGTGRACLAAPFLWVCLEFLLPHLPDIGFPWNLLGYVAGGNLAFVQLTTITGIFGLSLLVASYNALTAWMVLQISKRDRRSLGLWLGATAALIVAGLAGPRLVPQAAADHIAHLVQTNFPVSMSYPADWMQLHAPELDQLEQISVSAAQKIPGVVIWPEVPAPFSLRDGRFLARAKNIARGAGGGFLLGVVDWKPLADGGIGAYNSAAVLDSAGTLSFLYDKIHLVPFSEYVPWRKWLSFAESLTGIVGDFQHGSQYKVGRFPGGRFSVLICYEAIFPNEVRRFTLAGAELLVNISDDGWFGGSAAPAQHLAIARVRAVENRRWLLRDTNNGITVSVDPYGRIAARLATDIRGQLDAPYGFRSGLTYYARRGDWLPWLCVIATLMLLLIGVHDRFARRNV
jgi:apolipoprotein N-acyltransferase